MTNFDSEGNFVPTESQQHYYEPVSPHTGNHASTIISVTLSLTFFTLLIVGIIQERSLVAFAGIVLVYCMLAIMPIAGILLLGYPLWHKWNLDKVRREHSLLDLQAKREEIQQKRETHEVKLYLAQSRLLPDMNGNRPYVFNPHSYSVVEVSSGNFAQNVPQHFHLEYNNKNSYEQEEIADAPDVPALLAPVPSFRELLTSGTVQSAVSQGKMLLGYNSQTGECRFGSWLDLYSCAIGGVSGSGKTTTVRFLLFQAVLAGAKLIMIDPHIGNPDESLAAQFSHFTTAHHFKPCDDTITPVLKRVQWLEKELARRKSTGAKTPVLVFVIDEFNALMRIPDIREKMSTLLVSIAQEGRKFGMFAVLMGQRWSQQDIGGADIRTSLASTLAHRFTDEGQAKLLIGGRTGAKCLELQTGHYFFRDTDGGLTEMITPDTKVEDGAIIQRLLTPSTEPLSSGYRAGTETSPENRYETSGNQSRKQLDGPILPITSIPMKTGRNEVETSPENRYETSGNVANELQEKMLRVIQMQASGKQKPEIIKTIWGVSPGGSSTYERANTEYQQVMNLIAEKLGA